MLLHPSGQPETRGQKAERHRPDIAEKDASGGEIKTKKTGGSSGDAEVDRGKSGAPAEPCGDTIEREAEKCLTARKSVRAIHEVVQVDHPRRGERYDDRGDRAHIRVSPVGEPR